MDDAIQALAVLVFIIISVVSSLINTYQESKKKKQREQQKQRPQQKPHPAASQPRKQPVPPTKPAYPQKWSPSPQQKSAPPAERAEESERHDSGRKARDILREFLDVELPQVVPAEPTQEELEEQERKRQQRQRAKKRAFKKQEQHKGYQSTIPNIIPPITLSQRGQAAGPNQTLQRLTKGAEKNPVRAAILLSEIIRPPVSIRHRARPYLRQ
jgi:hypothetical protein